jgi:hypothetical protein
MKTAPPGAGPSSATAPARQAGAANGKAGPAVRGQSAAVFRDRAAMWLTHAWRAPRIPADGSAKAPSIRWLARVALVIALCLLGLVVIAPLGGTAQSVSPIARAWPWLLAPARLFFPGASLHVGIQPEHNASPWPGFVFAALLVTAALAAGAAVVRCLWEQGSDRRHLAIALIGAALFALPLVLLPSMPSDDVFSYVIYGRIAALHHANPLVATPADFPQDPLLSFVYWRNVRSVYGPVWLLVSDGLTRLSLALGGGLATAVLLFKLLGVASHLANMTLIWLILGRLAPSRRLLGTLFYGWCPLCLLEFGASGHNDALMLTLLLVAVLCLVRRWEVPGLIALGLSIAIKYVPLALLPFYLFAVMWQVMERHSSGRRGGTDQTTWRRPTSAALRAGLLAAGWRLALVLAVVGAATLPYWAGPGTLQAVLYSPPAERLDNSWLEAISWPLRWVAQSVFGLSASSGQAIVETLLKGGALLAFAALWLREFRRARGLQGTLEAWAWVLLWYVLVASGWFWPWYVTWIVVVVALLPWSELSVATLLLAGGVLVLYAFRPLRASPVYGYRSLLAFGPAVGYLVYVALERRRSHSSAAAATSTRLPSASIRPVSSAPPKATDGMNHGEGAPSRA